VGAALLSAVLFGVTTPLAKILVGGESPLLMAGLLYLGSGIGVGLLRWSQDGGASPAGLTRSDWPWLAAATVAGGVVAPALLLIGLQRAEAASAALLLNLEVVFTALLAWLVFREPTSGRVVLGWCGIVAGGLVLVWPGRALHGLSPGPLAIAAACLAWALDNNFTRKISAGDARVIAGVKGLAAGTTNTALAFSLGATLPPVPYLAGTLALGFVGYGISLVLFVIALRNLGTARTSAYFATAPFIGAATALILFGEPGGSGFWLAAGCMGAGVWLHLTESHMHEHDHHALTHSHVHVHDQHHGHAHEPGIDAAAPHTHEHRHEPGRHSHPHFPDIHHQHRH
jgi:drug/metabolite transporter (DMT)-like permease